MDNDLLNTFGWKRLKRFARNKKKLDRIVKQARLKRICYDPYISLVFKYQETAMRLGFLNRKKVTLNGEMQKRLKLHNYLIIRL